MVTKQELTFFASYPNFKVNPRASAEAEFQRLANYKKWPVQGAIYKNKLNAFKVIQDGYDPGDSEIGSVESQLESLSIASSESSSPPEGFPEFVSDDSVSLEMKLNQLAIEEGWAKNSRKYRDKRAILYLEEFSWRYGSREDKLPAWQSICQDMEISPVPSSITQCKKALAPYKINIYDFIECRHNNEKPHPVFRSVQKLRVYSYSNNKVFPLRRAKGNYLLQALLKNFNA